MDNCIFCQIAAGQSPCYKVYEDENYLAFLDIFPRTKGHTILIPKKHYRWVYEVEDFSGFWQTALKITKKMKAVLNPTFITYVTHGLEVPHAHIHIMPRSEKEIEFSPEIKKVTKEEMKEMAKKLF
jgi:histidine triad (HIT) family protein